MPVEPGPHERVSGLCPGGVGQLKTLSCAVSMTDMMRFWGDPTGPIVERELEWAGTSLKARQEAGRPRRRGVREFRAEETGLAQMGRRGK